MATRDATFYRLKGAMRDLVKQCGGVQRAAETCGCAMSSISRFQSNDADDLPGIMAVMALEADAGRPLISRILLEQAGGGAAQADTFVSFAAMAQASGAAMAACAEAMSDGEISPAEAERIDRAVSEAEQSACNLRKALSVVKGGRG